MLSITLSLFAIPPWSLGGLLVELRAFSSSHSLTPVLNIVIIAVLVIGLSLLLRFDALPNTRFARLSVLFFVVILVLIIASLQGWTAREFGIRTDTLSTAFFPYLLFTIIGVVAIFIFAKTLGREIDPIWCSNPHFRFLFIPLSFGQQVLFSGFLLPNLQVVFSSPVIIVTIYAALFTSLHIIYPNPKMNIPLGIVAGIAFCVMYLYYPNFILIGSSHAILNFFTVLFGFMSYPHSSRPESAP